MCFLLLWFTISKGNFVDFYLGVIRLLDLILVHLDLQLVLVPHLHQCLRQLALKILLVATVQLNHARLVAPLHFPQFLLGKDQKKQHKNMSDGNTALRIILFAILLQQTDLRVEVLLELQLLFEGLDAILTIHPSQHLILQLLSGIGQTGVQLLK